MSSFDGYHYSFIVRAICQHVVRIGECLNINFTHFACPPPFVRFGYCALLDLVYFYPLQKGNRIFIYVASPSFLPLTKYLCPLEISESVYRKFLIFGRMLGLMIDGSDILYFA